MNRTSYRVIRPYQNNLKKLLWYTIKDEHIIKKSPAFTTMEPGMGGTGFGSWERRKTDDERGILRQMFQGYEDLQLLSHRCRLAWASNEMRHHQLKSELTGAGVLSRYKNQRGLEFGKLPHVPMLKLGYYKQDPQRNDDRKFALWLISGKENVPRIM